MEQTFNDLLRERAENGQSLTGFALRICLETTAGIAAENLSLVKAIVMSKRMALWLAVVVALLMIPLVAMQMTNEVQWGPIDFAFMGTLLLATGFAYELIARRTGITAHKLAAGIGIAAAFFLVWANAAVGIVGEPGGPNVMYFGVVAVGIVGALLARFESRGMALTLFAMAAVHFLVTATALALRSIDPPGIGVVLCFNGLFIALFLRAEETDSIRTTAEAHSAVPRERTLRRSGDLKMHRWNSNQPVRVLLLEDDELYSVLVRKLLHDHRYQFEVFWVERLSEAIEKLQQEAIDVVLTDLSVPDSSGFATVTELKKHAGDAPIIVLTSLEDEELEIGLLAAGAQDYLLKDEVGERSAARSIMHSLQRQRSVNEIRTLARQLEERGDLVEEQSRLLQEKNQRLQKLYETANEFVDNVSHDFRTPLTVIKDFVTLIRDGVVGEINDEQRDMLDKVIVRSEDLNNMVDDLLDVSKLESGLLSAWRRKIDLKSIMQRAGSMLRHRAAVRNVSMEFDVPDDLATVYCDSDKLLRVITNLATNAIKFSGDQGNVRIWAENDPVDNQVVVGVTDNGPGIDPDSLNVLFQRFRQLDNHSKTTGKGFGLGLSIAQQLCRLNFGLLSVKSQVGNGSTFSFSIPMAQPREVVRRWMTMRSQPVESAFLIEFAIDDDVEESSADEFDVFLSGVVRSSDLMFRVDVRRWVLVICSPRCELPQWEQRMECEYEQSNRNRPLGPLPDFRRTMLRHFDATDSIDAIVADFDTAARVSFRLRAAGFETMTAGDGNVGVAAAEEYRPDLILLDVMMPNKDGMQALANGEMMDCVDRIFAMLDSFEGAIDKLTEPAAADAVETNGPWVLSIEDDDDFSCILQVKLRESGFQVIRASEGREGYRRAFIDAPTAILLDFNLPEGNGDYVLRRLKESPATRDIPVIVLTGRKEANIERRMRGLGADEFLNKPLDWERLHEALRSRLPADLQVSQPLT
eukprot:g8344.t1